MDTAEIERAPVDAPTDNVGIDLNRGGRSMESFRHYETLSPDLGSELIDSAGDAGFSGLLLRTAQRFDSVEEVFAYRISGTGAPEALLTSSRLINAERRVASYARSYYRDDPAKAALATTTAGQGFAGRVRASDIRNAEYRSVCFEEPALSDKLCFGWRDESQLIVLSFYRRNGSERRISRSLSYLAHLSLTALARQSRRQLQGRHPVARLEFQLEKNFPLLSLRERQVCARTILGHTSQQIAKELYLRPGTVLTYRQRAYLRCGFSRASDFVSYLLD